MIRVLILGGSGLLRGALAMALSSEDDIEVVAEVSGLESLDVAPDVIIVDVDEAGPQAQRAWSSGRRWEPLKLVNDLTAILPGAAVIVLATRQTPTALRRALAADVRGFLGKDLAPGELIQMIRQVHGGARVIDPVTAVAALSAAANPLTEREREILGAAAEGLSPKEIARRFFLTHGTVRNHLSAILRKTGGRSRWDAVRRAQDAGWL